MTPSDTLQVGFDEAKLNDPVSELSTGWRPIPKGLMQIKMLQENVAKHRNPENTSLLSEWVYLLEPGGFKHVNFPPKKWDALSSEDALSSDHSSKG